MEQLMLSYKNSTLLVPTPLALAWYLLRSHANDIAHEPVLSASITDGRLSRRAVTEHMYTLECVRLRFDEVSRYLANEEQCEEVAQLMVELIGTLWESNGADRTLDTYRAWVAELAACFRGHWVWTELSIAHARAMRSQSGRPTHARPAPRRIRAPRHLRTLFPGRTRQSAGTAAAN